MSVPAPTPSPAPSAAWIGLSAAVPDALPLALRRYEDSDDFLLAPAPYDHALYVVELAQRGIRGLDLLRLLRRRLAAPLLALDDGPCSHLVEALESGADMVLPAASPPAHLRAALQALQRRCAAPGAEAAAATRADGAWRLQPAASRLLTPGGQSIPLNAADLNLLRCFAQAPDGRAPRGQLCMSLWGMDAGESDNALHATLYRLRRRIEQASGLLLPIRSVARQGYEFRAPLLMEEA